jgi:hypothetical protein
MKMGVVWQSVIPFVMGAGRQHEATLLTFATGGFGVYFYIYLNDNYNLIIFPSAVNTVLLSKAVIRGPYTKLSYNQSIKMIRL